VGNEQDFKKRVHEVITRKQLCSIMNDTPMKIKSAVTVKRQSK
jgi:hypothetical protein